MAGSVHARVLGGALRLSDELRIVCAGCFFYLLRHGEGDGAGVSGEREMEKPANERGMLIRRIGPRVSVMAAWVASVISVWPGDSEMR